jgi:GGDEF domain-containing protein
LIVVLSRGTAALHPSMTEMTEPVEVARSPVRPGDLTARYGGEEFAILAPGLPAQDLTAFADRIRESVAGTPIAVGPDTTIIADQRLYHAKHQGRNLAVTSGDAPVGPGGHRESVPA